MNPLNWYPVLNTHDMLSTYCRSLYLFRFVDLSKVQTIYWEIFEMPEKELTETRNVQLEMAFAQPCDQSELICTFSLHVCSFYLLKFFHLWLQTQKIPDVSPTGRYTTFVPPLFILAVSATSKEIVKDLVEVSWCSIICHVVDIVYFIFLFDFRQKQHKADEEAGGGLAW